MEPWLQQMHANRDKIAAVYWKAAVCQPHLFYAAFKWSLIQKTPCNVNILVLISLLQKQKCRKMKWLAQGHTCCIGLSLALWPWSLRGLSVTSESLFLCLISLPTGQRQMPWHERPFITWRQLAPSLYASSSPVKPWLCVPRLTTYIPILSPLPTFPAQSFMLCYPCTANSRCLKP